jgi:hypothetical protein
VAFLSNVGPLGFALFVALVGFILWWALENRRRRTHPVPAGFQADIEFPHDEPFELYHNALSTSGATLLPDDPVLVAEMETWIDRSSITENPIENGAKSAGNAIPGLTLPLFCTMIEKIPAWKIGEGLLFHFDKIRPVLFLTFKLCGIHNLAKLKPAASAIGRSRKQMNVHLDALEAKLAETGGPWILGEMFSLADVSWLAIFERLRQVDAEDVFLGDGKRPKTTAYWDRLTTRPSYAAAILGHSHPLIVYGQNRIAEAKAADAALRHCLVGA